MKNIILKSSRNIVLSTILIVFAVNISFSEKKPFTFSDAMKFLTIKKPIISNDGKWVAYCTVPDRGDATGYVKSTENDSIIVKIDYGSNPSFTKNSKWVGFMVSPKSIETENNEKDKKKLKNGMSVLNVFSGKKHKYENIKEFRFSEDSRWLAVYQSIPEPPKKEEDKSNPVIGANLILRELESGSDLTLLNVTEFAFDSLSNFLAYTVAEDQGKANGLYVIKLNGSFALPQKIQGAEKTYYSSIAWSSRYDILGYAACKSNKKEEPDSCSLMIWDSRRDTMLTAISRESCPEGWYIPYKNELKWTDDDNRLFFGFKPFSDTIPTEEKITFTDTNFYDAKTILKKTDADLWHYNDPRIKTNEKNWWDKNKERTFRSVFNYDIKKYQFIADLACPNVEFTDNPNFTIGTDDSPYLKDATWDGFYFDLYAINLKLGIKKLVVKRLSESASLSPQGSFIAYYKDKNWYLYNCLTDSTRNLTQPVPYPFYNEDNDVPEQPGSYGIGGWFENEQSLYINDKYDIWRFYTTNDGYISQTSEYGREFFTQFRILNLDPLNKYLDTETNYLMTGYNEKKKYTGIHFLSSKILGPDIIDIDSTRKYKLIAQSLHGSKILFTRENYREFPDLCIGDSVMKKTKKITNVNPQIKDFEWGSTQLINWVNGSGDTLDGYIIKPDNFNPNKRYPVIVYYYERFSQLMFNFSIPYVGHRPCPQIYNSDGYVMFMPDIKFKIGSPGFSSVDCITTGLKKLINMGIADSNALGITGHSWSGYQTAYMITKTNMFKAAVAGAPVGNMTSAYSGIRNESGLARQFQYEMQQSRIGGNLWDSLDSYIRNSPVFQARTIKTPFLIMFGDADPMVPWQQGVELYLAMRRLNKECLFLQYHKEYHWPEKYPNRLDYGIKMKEFFDTYLLKKQTPEWILNGIRYKGEK